MMFINLDAFFSETILCAHNLFQIGLQFGEMTFPPMTVPKRPRKELRKKLKKLCSTFTSWLQKLEFYSLWIYLESIYWLLVA